MDTQLREIAQVELTQTSDVEVRAGAIEGDADKPGDGGASASNDGQWEADGPGYDAVRVLQARSRLAQALKTVPPFMSILIIEDNQRDSDRLASTLRTMFGYEVTIRQCRTLGTALDAVMAEQPDLVFLDDRLGPIDRAEKSIPFLRAAKCQAVVIVVSSHVDRRRRADLIKLGAGDVIDKDELDSTTISQALIGAKKAGD